MDFNTFRDSVHEPKRAKMTGDRLYRLERKISVRISYMLFRLFPHIRPNVITALSLAVLGTVFIMGVYTASVANALMQMALLYSITFLDKVDGELARARGVLSQRGAYLDRCMHMIYPFVFYFVIASYFLIIHPDFRMFTLTLLAGLLTQMQGSQREWRLLIGEKIEKEKMVFHDEIGISREEKERPNLVVRVLDYLTFMVYAWIPFLYMALIAMSGSYPAQAYHIYVAHIALTVIVGGYKVFLSYPRDRLFTRDEAERLRGGA